jgi:hypothetical protein
MRAVVPDDVVEVEPIGFGIVKNTIAEGCSDAIP